MLLIHLLPDTGRGQRHLAAVAVDTTEDTLNFPEIQYPDGFPGDLSNDGENGILGMQDFRDVLWSGMWPGRDRGKYVLHGVTPDSAGELLERGGIDGKSSPGEICFVPVRAIPDGPKMSPSQTADGGWASFRLLSATNRDLFPRTAVACRGFRALSSSRSGASGRCRRSAVRPSAGRRTRSHCEKQWRRRDRSPLR